MRVLPYDGPMADWPEVEAVTGAEPALAILHESARLIVVSNADTSRPHDVRRALARVGLARYIAGVITPDIVGVTKEEHAFWPAVLRHLDLDRAAVIVVGDSYDRDIVPAARAGLRTVWLTNGQQWRQGNQVVTIGALTDLPAAVRILAANGCEER
jgi:putative hydrolase of the HAD superfamily